MVMYTEMYVQTQRHTRLDDGNVENHKRVKNDRMSKTHECFKTIDIVENSLRKRGNKKLQTSRCVDVSRTCTDVGRRHFSRMLRVLPARRRLKTRPKRNGDARFSRKRLGTANVCLGLQSVDVCPRDCCRPPRATGSVVSVRREEDVAGGRGRGRMNDERSGRLTGERWSCQ